VKVKRFIVGPFEVCSYVVFSSKGREAVIIDPGHPDENIVKFIEENQLKPLVIIATHAHADHVYGVNFLKEKFKDLKYLVHQDDAEFFSKEENFKPFKVWGFPSNPEPDEVLKDGSEVEFGGEVLKVIHTPGHSPGSCCFYSEKHGVLFTGDTLFVGAVGRADLPGGNYFQMMESIKNKLLTLPMETVIFPGHDYGPKPTSTLEDEVKSNPFIREFL